MLTTENEKLRESSIKGNFEVLSARLCFVWKKIWLLEYCRVKKGLNH